eukprot:m.101783 g.101783  ORF g.101783 m.101783 type:complete len:426 (-) comp13756_c1_seq2:285-1562(-)
MAAPPLPPTPPVQKISFANDGSFMAQFQAKQKAMLEKRKKTVSEAFATDDDVDNEKHTNDTPSAPTSTGRKGKRRRFTDAPPGMPPPSSVTTTPTEGAVPPLPPLPGQPQQATPAPASAIPSTQANADGAVQNTGDGELSTFQIALMQAKQKAQQLAKQAAANPTPPSTTPTITHPGDAVGMVNIPGELVGRIIGEGGVTLQAIETQCGCKLQIPIANMPGTTTRLITIRGPQHMIEPCRRMIMQNVGYGQDTITAEEIEAKLNPKMQMKYDSDEDNEGGTWEHRRRLAEMKKTEEEARLLTEKSEGSGKRHLADYLPKAELERFMEKADAIKTGRVTQFNQTLISVPISIFSFALPLCLSSILNLLIVFVGLCSHLTFLITNKTPSPPTTKGSRCCKKQDGPSEQVLELNNKADFYQLTRGKFP